MASLKIYITLMSFIFLLTACDDTPPPPSSIKTTTESSTASSIMTDAWLGKWNGPEGTYIDISGANGIYKVVIADLDGPSQYQGVNSGNKITFNRDGVIESIQASNGTDTGMKWLDGKSNCLRVSAGEGWCRD